MKIEAYICQYCDSLYKTQKRADDCEKLCVIKKQEEETIKSVTEKLNQEQDDIRLNSTSLEDVIKGCIDYQNKVAVYGKLLDMELDVKYHNHTSNSHSAPIGKPSNFSRKDGVPTGYPALSGRVVFHYSADPKDKAVGGSICRFINKGTGGGGGKSKKGDYCVTYDVKLWLDDFPKIKGSIEKVLNDREIFENFKIKVSDEIQIKMDNDEHLQTLLKTEQGYKDKIANLQKELQRVQCQRNEVCSTLRKPFEDKVKKESDKLINPWGILIDKYLD